MFSLVFRVGVPGLLKNLKNEIMIERIKIGLMLIGLLILLGIVGRMDYTEEVIYTMPEKSYKEIRIKLGDDASDYDIARYYVKHYNKEEQ